MENLLKKISLFIGGLLVIASGLLFILLADLYGHSGSIVLFIGVILGVGGGILFILAESFRHKKGVYITLKVLGIILSILFVVYLFRMMSQNAETMAAYAARRDDYDQTNDLKFIEDVRLRMHEVFNCNAVRKLFKTFDGKTIFAFNKNFKNGLAINFSYKGFHYAFIAMAMLATAVQGFNLTYNIIKKIEE